VAPQVNSDLLVKLDFSLKIENQKMTNEVNSYHENENHLLLDYHDLQLAKVQFHFKEIFFRFLRK